MGQSVWHGFVAVSSRSDAKTVFMPVSMLAPALVVLAVYPPCRRLGLREPAALAAAVAAGLLPSLSMIHLWGFQSQALGTPLMVFAVTALDDLADRPSWGRLSAAALLGATLFSVYTEFYPFFLILLAVGGALLVRRHPTPWGLAGAYALLAGSPGFFNPVFFKKSLEIFRGRVLEHTVDIAQPQYYHPASLGTNWCGGLGVPAWWAAVVGVAGLTLGLAGLLRACLERLAAGRAAGPVLGRRRPLAVALGLLALASLPAAAMILVPGGAYLIFKLHASFDPLLVVGVALLCRSGQPTREPARPRSPAGALPAEPVRKPGFGAVPPGATPWAAAIGRGAATWHAALGWGVLGVVLALGLGGTLRNADAFTRTRQELDQFGRTQGTHITDPFRSRGYVLLEPEVVGLLPLVEGLRGQNVLLACGQTQDSRDADAFLNAWLAYLARRNRVWLTNPYFVSEDDPFMQVRIEDTAACRDLSALPEDLLVLSYARGRGFQTAPPEDATSVGSSGSFRLWKPARPNWVLPIRVNHAAGIEELEGQPLFWVGPQTTELEVVTAAAGHLVLEAKLLPGPDAAGPRPCQLHVAAGDQGGGIGLEPGPGSIRLPVPAGRVVVSLTAAGQPARPAEPGQEPAGRLVGVQGLRLRLEP